MSPSSREINGPRPAPLKLHKDSHTIQKQSSSSITTTATGTTNTSNQRLQPVIIYTHSPKVIHTQAQDFMALVQKLTGLSRSPDDTPLPSPKQTATTKDSTAAHDPPSPSSDNCGPIDEPPQVIPASAMNNMPTLGFEPPSPSLLGNNYMSEIPLFTPNSSDFFCSPRSFYRYSEPMGNIGGSISPSLMETMKAFPEF